MGLVTMIPKAINYGAKVAYRGAKVSPDIIFGKGAEVFVNNASKAAKAAIKADKGWVTAFKEAIVGGGKAVETSVAAAKAAKGGFLKQAWTALKGAPGAIATRTAAGARAARIAGKSSILGGVKGFFSGIGKKMPLIGNLILVACELPNIYTATKEQGLVQGAKETVKAGARLGGAAIGAAIGSAFGPIGSLAGWIAGEWLTSKVVGSSYTEQKAEAQEKQAELEAQMQEYMQNGGMQEPTINPYGTYNQTAYNPYNFGTPNPFQNPSAYDGDIMMQKLNFQV